MTDFFFCHFQLWRLNVNFVKFDPDVVFCQIRPRVSKTTKTTGFSVTYFPSVWMLPLLPGLQKHWLQMTHGCGGLGVLRPLTTDESAIRRQGITNMTCRDSNQWLNANPAYLFNQMNNHGKKFINPVLKNILKVHQSW